jgi:hypothetical protein
MVYDLVLILADKLGGVEPGQSRRRRVDEGGVALSVEAVDSLPRRVEDKPILTVEPLDLLFSFPVLGDVLHHTYGEGGLALDPLDARDRKSAPHDAAIFANVALLHSEAIALARK